MHETALAAHLIRLVETNACAVGAARVLTVRLELGEFAGVEPRLLESAFTSLAARTMLEGAALEIDVVRLRARCEDCQHQFHVEQFRFRCPDCGSDRTHVVAGEDMVLKNLSVAMDSPCMENPAS